MNISVTRSSQLKPKPNESDLGFGRYFSDHMFLCDYNRKEGWYNPRITPYEPLMMDPGASSLHYGQALFEGMKAFRQESGKIVLFRPDFNWNRMRFGAERLCMEMCSQEIFTEGIRQLVDVDQDWVPKSAGTSLYIRPTLIGTEGFLGVRPADEYLFFVILSPVGNYYGKGASSLKIWIEKKYLRAAPGGLGATKAAANYAASLRAAHEAKANGYSQVLWLDTTHEYVEEVGTMNVFFRIGNEIITPSLEGSILPGGVRDCVLRILRSWNLPVVERRVKLAELLAASKKGELKEIFGTGTAAVISPVSELNSSDISMKMPEVPDSIASRLAKELGDLQYGRKPDTWGWIK